MHQHRNNDGIIADFESDINALSFPCVGAKSALARNNFTYCIADDIHTASSDETITKELQLFALSCTSQSVFISFIVIFQNSLPLSEIEFESCLWERLQAIHNKDVMQYEWDNQVSADPNSPEFSLSVGGKGFYVVGLHPNASRVARQFTKPTLVFNLHNQFELLRANGIYEGIRKTILARDIELCGIENPMLAEHGKSSEARQYSGRALETDWQCPFHAHKKRQEHDQ